MPYREVDAAATKDAYAISKWEAEQGLQRIVQKPDWKSSSCVRRWYMGGGEGEFLAAHAHG